MDCRSAQDNNSRSGSSSRASRIRPDPYLLACLVLGLILFSPLAAQGLPQAPDAALHYYRATIWRWAWDEGVLWPRWSTLLFQGYGYPVLNFSPPLPYLLAALASYILPGVLAGFKLVFLAACLCYAAGMYLWAREALGSPPAALVAAAAYTFAISRFRELYSVGGATQFLAWSLYPWALLAFLRLARQPTRPYIVLAACALAGVILTHNISTMLLAPVLGCYLLYLMVAHRQQRSWPWLVVASAGGVLLAAVYWLPMAAEIAATRVHVLIQGYWDVRLHFLRLHDFFSAVTPLDDRAVNPPLPFTYGPLPLILAGAGALTALLPGQRPGRRGHLLFATGLVLAASFMMLPESYPVWHTVFLLKFAQYPWRVFGVALLGMALLAGAAVDWLARWPPLQRIAAGLLVCGLVLSVFVYQFPRPFLQFEESPAGLLHYETGFRALGTTGGNEFLPPWVESLPSEPALAPDLVRRALASGPPGISGSVVSSRESSLTLDITAAAPGAIQVAQFYYPGWRGWLDGAPVSLRPSHPAGLIELDVPAGPHRLELRFDDTLVRTLAAGLSVAAVLGTLAVAALSRRPGRTEPAVQGDLRSGLLCAGLLLLLLLLKVLWIGPHTTWFRLASPPGTALPASHQVQAPVGPDVMLLGYDLAPATLAPGSELAVTLYWQATSPLDRDLASFVHLAAGPADAVFAQSDRQHPGYVPTSTWPTDRYVIDAHRVQIPADMPQIAYKVIVGLYDPATGQRWGETTLDVPVHVVERSPAGGAAISHADVRLDGGIELVGYDLAPERDEIELTLYWRVTPGAARSSAPDYQVLLHLLDANGSQIAGADGPPVEGLYPTSQWLSGQLIADRRRIQVPAGSTAATLRVGLYDLATMQRLAVVDAGRATVSDNAILLPVPAVASPS